ncbi:MAG: hypothetical protein WAP03_26825 [Methylorubrum rhodinum]|uniref:hypothetical protein n=1 Tax=Methylorubrum rhodinum TaxID=29428 RepID=UPI003BAF0C21
MTASEIARLFDRVSEHRSAGGTMSSPDLDRYRPYVAHLDMPEAAKDDMLLAVYRTMQSFVDRAFGDDPVQRCGRLEDKKHAKDESIALPVIEWQDKSPVDEDQALDDVFHRYAVGETDEQEKR